MLKKITSQMIRAVFFTSLIIIVSAFLASAAVYVYIKNNPKSVENFIEKELELVVGYDVEIGSIDAKWNLTNPSAIVNDFEILNANNEKSLGAQQIDVDFSWWSILKLEPTLDKISIYQPHMTIVKETDGVLTVNGIRFDYDEGEGEFSNWLLNQDDVFIIDGDLTWVDLSRGEEKLTLEALNLHYSSSKIFSIISRREFSITSYISPGTQEKINLNGHFDLQDLEALETVDAEINISVSNFDLASLRPWLDYPVPITTGFGSIDILAEVKNGQLALLDGAADVENLVILAKNNNSLKINSLESLINIEYIDKGYKYNLNEASLVLDNGLSMNNVNVKAKTIGEDLVAFGLTLDTLNLASLIDLAQYFPDELEETKKNLEALSPRGSVTALNLDWNKGDSFFAGLNLKMQANNLSVKAYQDFPGIQNFSGALDVQDYKGLIRVNSKNFVVSKYDTFREDLKFNELKGLLSWNKNAFMIKNISASNTDFEAVLNGRYNSSDSDDDSIDVTIDIPRADISDLKEYYPKQMGKEALNWLDTSLLKGVANNTKVVMRGKLKDFPFIDDKNNPDENEGIFRITSKITGSEIEYGTNWPNAENFNIDFKLNASRIEFTSETGEIADNKIISFKGVIPNFTDDVTMLNIDAELDSPLNTMIKFINSSPVKDEMQGRSEGLLGDGSGKLRLSLKIPLSDVDNLTYDGIYSFQNSSLESPELDLPLLQKMNGDLFFNLEKVSITNLKATIYDEPLLISLSNANQKTVLDVQGFINTDLIESKLGEKWSERIYGNTPWNAQMVIDEKESFFSLESDLKGLEIKSLQIFDKKAETSMPFKFSKKSPSSGKDFIDLSLGTLINSRLIRDTDNVIRHGFIGINANPEMPKNEGVVVIANFEELNNEYFEFIFEEDEDDISPKNSNAAIKKEFDPLIDSAIINVGKLTFEGNTFTAASFDFYPIPSGYELDITSNEATGELTWNEDTRLYQANFSKIHLKKDDDKETVKEKTAPIMIEEDLNESRLFSKINLDIASFKINETDYGRVELSGVEDIDGFVFEKLKINNAAYSIEGNGYWKSEGFPLKTSINFKWSTKDIGAALSSFGYDDLINKGEAVIEGLVTWDDRPSNFDVEDFYGNFSLLAKNGVVKKVEPGMAGRLVGLISLQNLPRRLTLDFSDLFEEGLPFDRIESKKTVINKGVLNSPLFEIEGPSANIRLNGDVDFIKETQDMRVTIEPKISDTVTAGALVGGPFTAAIAFLAQKILDDPFNKITTAEYHVTGTWQEPKEKIVDTKVDNFIEDEILEPTGNIIQGTGEVIDEYLIEPTGDAIDYLFNPQDKPQSN